MLSSFKHFFQQVGDASLRVFADFFLFGGQHRKQAVKRLFSDIGAEINVKHIADAERQSGRDLFL